MKNGLSWRSIYEVSRNLLINIIKLLGYVHLHDNEFRVIPLVEHGLVPSLVTLPHLPILREHGGFLFLDVLLRLFPSLLCLPKYTLITYMILIHRHLQVHFSSTLTSVFGFLVSLLLGYYYVDYR
jgi:hypothetical protein